MQKCLGILALCLLLLEKVGRRFAEVLRQPEEDLLLLEEDWRMSEEGLGKFAEDHFMSAKVLFMSEEVRRKDDEDLLLVAAFLRRFEKVGGGLERVVRRFEKARLRFDEDLFLFAE